DAYAFGPVDIFLRQVCLCELCGGSLRPLRLKAFLPTQAAIKQIEVPVQALLLTRILESRKGPALVASFATGRGLWLGPYAAVVAYRSGWLSNVSLHSSEQK